MQITRRLCRALGDVVSKNIDKYSQFQPSSLSVQNYLDFGRTGDQTQSYVFLRNEMLVRLANIMKEINLLPNSLRSMPSCGLVQEWYQQSFVDFIAYEKKLPKDGNLRDFNELLQAVLKRHSNVVETMAEGLMELKQSHGIDVASERHLQYFLDRFYLNRISIRMLMNQHLLLFGTLLPDSPRHVGAFDTQCDVAAVVNDAFENARFLCDRYYMRAPEMTMTTVNAVAPNTPITVEAVPAHLYHIMFELLKNAMRAVVEHHGVEADELPDLQVTVVCAAEDLTIKIADRGGGVPRSTVDNMFNYMYSTAPPPDRDGTQAPLAGYGYGLPLSRLYARYFQGDVNLVSMEGYGTDALVFMKSQAPEAHELIPIYSTASIRQYTQATMAPDWTTGQGSLFANSTRNSKQSPADATDNGNGRRTKTPMTPQV